MSTQPRRAPARWRRLALTVALVALSVGCGYLIQAAQSGPTHATIPTLAAASQPQAAASPLGPSQPPATLAGFPAPFATPTLTGVLPELGNVGGAGCIPKVAAESGTVVEVVDGERIRVRLDADGQIRTVRYIGVDAPEPDGTQKNAQLVDAQPVRLVRDTSDADQNGDLLRYVVTPDTFVNLALVLEGAARAVGAPPDVACFTTFQQAEQDASARRLGLWAHEGEFGGFPTSEIGAYCACGGRDLDCRDFGTRREAQSCFGYCKLLGYGDVFHLDNDGDGSVCVGLP